MKKAHSRSYCGAILCGLLSMALLVLACTKEVSKPGKPTANAGSDQSVSVKTWVQLDGSASRPSAPGRLLTYKWTIKSRPQGSGALINEQDSVRPIFFADKEGQYSVELVVNDGIASSDPDEVVVTVDTCGNNAPAVSSINANPASPNTEDVVQLSAQVSDADTLSPCNLSQTWTYSWALSKLPSGSQARLNNGSALNPSFTADRPGNYEVTLVVTDSTGLSSSPFTATIIASDCGNAAPSVSSIAATPPAPNTGDTVQLSATVTDADTLPSCSLTQGFSYSWSFITVPAGSTAQLNGSFLLTPSFTADVPGDYVVQLIVTDSTGRVSAPATLLMTASLCGSNAPVVTNISATPSGPNTGDVVQLSATFTDSDLSPGCGLSQSFTYSWGIISLPSGSQAKLNNSSASNPSFAADKPGDYQVQLVVTDSTGRASAPASLIVTVSTCGSNAPSIASISAFPAAPNTGQVVQLSAAFTDTDVSPSCGLSQGFTYSWLLLGLPSGSKAQLNSSSASNPSFTGDVPGTYTAQLIVTDSTGRMSLPVTLDISLSTCGSASPVALVGLLQPMVVPASSLMNFTETAGILTQLDGSSSYDADNLSPCSQGQTLSYQWAFSLLPPGSAAALNNTNVSNPSFTPDVPGLYEVLLQVTDSTGRTSAFAQADVVIIPATIEGPGVGLYSSLKLDSSGAPRVAYYDFFDADLRYAVLTGNNWSTQSVDIIGSVGEYPSLSLSPAGSLPRISYRDATNGSLKFASWDGSQWLYSYADTPKNVGQFSSVKVDGAGVIKIAYYDATSQDLKYAVFNGANSYTISTVYSVGDVGRYASLALYGPNEWPMIAYYDATNGYLDYAVCTAGCETTSPTWRASTVDTGGDVGQYASIAISSSTYPNISYYDATGGDLKFAACTANCDTAVPVWTIRGIDATNNVGLWTSLSISSTTGRPRISYYDQTNGNLRYAVCTANCNTMAGTWFSGAVDTGGNVGQWTSIAEVGFGGALGFLAGLPAISYYDATTQNLKIAICFFAAACNTGFIGAGWASIPLDTTGGNEGQYTSLAMIGGTPIISYYDVTNQDLRLLALFVGDFPIDTAGNMGMATSLTISTSGSWMISYFDASDTALKLAEYLPAPQDRVRFHVVDGSSTVGLFGSLALDAAGDPRVAYYVPPGQLRYAICTANCGTASPTWAVSVVDVIDNVGQYASMSLDNVGIPRVTYYDAINGDLKLAVCSGNCTGAGATWTISTVDTAGNVGQYASLALSGAGDPRVSYYDGTNGSLRVAECTVGCSTTLPTWSLSTVDTTGGVGVGTSLALSIAGEPRIAYYDATNGDLKFASRSGALWNLSRLSTAGNVGFTPSLALSAAGNPRATFFDATNLTLRYYSYGD